MTSLERWAITAVVTCMATCLLAACGGQEEPTESTLAEKTPLEKAMEQLPPDQMPVIERGEDGAIRNSGKTETGEFFKAQLGGDVAMPETFPDDLPVYPNAVPFSAMETGGGTAIVSLESEAAPVAIYEFYKEQLPASGWTLEGELNIGEDRVLSGIKAGRKVVIHIEVTEDGTRIGFVLSPVS